MTGSAERVYRRLLRLLPRDLRREAEPELVDVFRDDYARVANRPWPVRAWFWCRIAADTVVASASERLSRPEKRRQRHPEETPMNFAAVQRSWFTDVRFALRAFRRAPWFFAGAILTLALGIGANGAVFSLLQAVLLRPLPYDRPSDVVMLWRARAVTPVGSHSLLQPSSWRGLLTSDNVKDWRSASHDVLTDVAGFLSWQGNSEAQFDLGLADHAERLRGIFVTPNMFDLLGVRAARGRLWTAADETATEPLIVLSDGLWRRAFGADEAIVGRPVTMMMGRPRALRTLTVVGVLPAEFHFTYPLETEAWVLYPWSSVDRYTKGAIGFRAVGRLTPGVSFNAARARMETVRDGLDYPNERPENREVVRLESISDWVAADARPTLMLLGGVAVLLLLITCATVAGALFVRLGERQRELAVRSSLGANRRRLVRQLLTEGAVLASAGTVAGVGLALLLQPALRTIVPSVVPRGDEIGLDLSMLGFAATVATVVTVLSTLLPAWRGARVDLSVTLKRTSGTSSLDRSSARWRKGLISAQAAITVALLVSAALFLVSFWNLGRVPLGFDADHIVTVEMRLLDAKYSPKGGALPQFQTDLVDRLRAVPDIVDVGLTSAVPFRGTDFVVNLGSPDQKRDVVGRARFVDPGYFSVMHMPVAAGRLFSAADGPGSEPVVVVSAAYGREMFSGANPVGQHIAYDGAVTVIGVVADARYSSLDKSPEPAIYFPRSQQHNSLICIVARTSPTAGNVGPVIRQIVHDLDPAIPAMNMTTLEQIISDSVANRRFFTAATTVFAALALLLTGVGLSVVVSRAVVERRREFAIRSALGAESARLIRLAALQGLWPVVSGTAVGLVAAAFGARVLEGFLFGVSTHAAWAYGAVAFAIIGVAAIASFVPARHIASSSVASVLRGD